MNKFLIFFIILVITVSANPLIASPLSGVVSVKSDSAKTGMFVAFFVQAASEYFRIYAGGDVVKGLTLASDLTREGCTDERCMLNFAHDASIDLCMFIDVKDKQDAFYLDVVIRSPMRPYFGKRLISYSVRIPLSKTFTPRENAYIAQEQAAICVGEALRSYTQYIPLKMSGDTAHSGTSVVNGTYSIVSVDGSAEEPLNESYAGEFSFSNGSSAITNADSSRKYFVLIPYEKDGENLLRFIRGRKKEIVLQEYGFESSLFAAVLTPILSPTAPLTLPLGYYANRDYSGLGLFLVNAAPWWGLSAYGLREIPDKGLKLEIDPPKTGSAAYYFGGYQMLFGNASLLADMLSHEALQNASRYNGVEKYYGNRTTAITLSLLTPGGGHFYRGSRPWGYFYYQLDSLLLYSVLRSYYGGSSAESKYMSIHKDSWGNGYGALWISVFAAVKTIECIHSALMNDAILSHGELAAGEVQFLPEFSYTVNDGTRIGAGVGVSW